MHKDVAIIIPSRISSQRLARKPLANIGSMSMIEHVLRNVSKTNLDNIYVATDSNEIAEKVESIGGKYIMTDPDHASGTDRVYYAAKDLDDSIKYVLNVQGDMPFVEPKVILEVIEYLKKSPYDIITPVVKVDFETANSASNVKVIIDNNNKALYFSRSMIPYGASEFLYHVGIYGFKRDALEKFVRLPKTSLETMENLEQLRALVNGIEIGVCYANSVPISIDTEEDLENAIKFYESIR